MRPHTQLIAAGLLASLTVFAYSSAQAQQKLVLKASDVHGAGYPTVVAVENLGKKLAATTNGRLTVAMYPSMQLGGEKETIEQTQIGAIRREQRVRRDMDGDQRGRRQLTVRCVLPQHQPMRRRGHGRQR